MDSAQKQIGVLLLYVGVLISLIVTVVNVFLISFGLINYLLMPPSFDWYDFSHGFLGMLPGSVAFFAVGFAVLITLSRKVRSLEKGREDATMFQSLSHAVVMLVLGVSLGAVVISFALLLEGILSGDVEFAFLLKLLVTVGVGAAVFYYYRNVLLHRWRERVLQERVFVSTLILVALLLVSSSVVVLNPLERRDVTATVETLEYLDSVSKEVKSYEKEYNRLPVSFTELSSNSRWFPPSDSVSEFSYTPLTKKKYELCAVFPILPQGTDLPRYPYTDFPVTSVGKQCFTFSV